MNSVEFARAWLKREGFPTDESYNGLVANAVIEVEELIARQGHSGFSASLLFECLARIQAEYTDPSKIIYVLR